MNAALKAKRICDANGHGVSARRGIMASHLEPAYAGVEHIDLPNTERITRESLILPVHHALTEDDQDHVVAVLRKLAGR